MPFPYTIQLKSLSVDIIFADLELILLRVPTLEDLELEGGMRDPDERDLVPAEDHRAHLKTVKIVNPSHPQGVQQLCWVLRPAIGTLQSLQFRLVTGVHHGGVSRLHLSQWVSTKQHCNRTEFPACDRHCSPGEHPFSVQTDLAHVEARRRGSHAS